MSFKYVPHIRERMNRKLNPYGSYYDHVLDDQEYTDFYKYNTPDQQAQGTDEYAD